MKELLFATGNPAKIRQFQFVADECGFDAQIVSLYARFPDVPRYSEEYVSQEKIVENGAWEAYGHIHAPLIVEDSILEVDALDGGPGLRSDEFLKTEGRKGLLHKMEGVIDRKAHLTSIVGYFDGTVLVSSKHVVEGEVARTESYKAGEPDWIGPSEQPFGGGFNAVFLLPESGRTLADFSAKEGIACGYREPNFKAILRYIFAK
jgi:non-canonical purine NTP pyrophosphatase (RdgB/HAM1 family)